MTSTGRKATDCDITSQESFAGRIKIKRSIDQGLTRGFRIGASLLSLNSMGDHHGINSQAKLESTVRYLGIEVADALEIAEQTEV
jgi:hypothetical protein